MVTRPRKPHLLISLGRSHPLRKVLFPQPFPCGPDQLRLDSKSPDGIRGSWASIPIARFCSILVYPMAYFCATTSEIPLQRERHKSPRNFYVGYTPRQSIKVVIRQPNRCTILLWQHVGNFGARDYSSQKKKRSCESSNGALTWEVQAVPRRRATSSIPSVK